ncbi:FCD domain-containing protein [Pseudomonas sp. NPDC007930]|uniref:GntR family transcriptional regulator n=1 Tax=Pseudomonas sp. NPDC007930 TaxID=3364417 RepID=UPI0036E1C163
MQLSSSNPPGKERREGLAERIYQQLKQDIFEFRLLPGDRFSEGDVAKRMDASRTPVRQALFRLEQEHYLEVHFRAGWQVRPFDFAYFEELYDVRIVLEQAAVKRLCENAAPGQEEALRELLDTWAVAPAQRCYEAQVLTERDVAFHRQLLALAGNSQMTRFHDEIGEKIHVLRRLDFTQRARIDTTFEEHTQILQAVLQRRADEAQRRVKAHIEVSKAEVRKITLHMLHCARG